MRSILGVAGCVYDLKDREQALEERKDRGTKHLPKQCNEDSTQASKENTDRWNSK